MSASASLQTRERAAAAADALYSASPNWGKMALRGGKSYDRDVGTLETLYQPIASTLEQMYTHVLIDHTHPEEIVEANDSLTTVFFPIVGGWRHLCPKTDATWIQQAKMEKATKYLSAGI